MSTIPWNKGKILSPFPSCTSCGISLKDRRSKTCWNCVDHKVARSKHPPRSEESKKKISEIMKGRIFTEEWKKNLSIAGKGKHSISKELRLKMIEGLKKRRGIIPKNLSSLHGENHWCWKGGITPEHRMIRSSAKYRDWRKSVFERDNYICQECGKMGGEINADHIQPFSLFPELRFNPSNGRTLCVKCHRETETYGINGKRKKELLAKIR